MTARPRSGHVRAKQKRFHSITTPPPPLTHKPFLALLNGEDDMPKKIDDQTILDEFWARGMFARFSINSIADELESRDLTTDDVAALRAAVPALSRARAAVPSPEAAAAMHYMANFPEGFGAPRRVWVRNATNHNKGQQLFSDAVFHWLIQHGFIVEAGGNDVALSALGWEWALENAGRGRRGRA